jgi:hypothetical protein
MAKLIYAAITSVDGYVVDEQGIFEWLNRMRRVHASINDLRRSVGAYVSGRRNVRDDGRRIDATLAAQAEIMRDFAHIWHVAEKSST